jgi:hypothetical protein
MSTILSENITLSNKPASEDPIFVLTSSQLQEIISRAIQPVKDEVAALREERDKDREEMASMRAKMASLEELIESKRQENIQEFDGIYVSLGKHRDRLDRLESPHKGPGETETARAEKIEKYLLSQPGRRASYESLRGHLGVDKFALNDAINVLMETSPGRYGIVHSPGDKRKRTLIMIPK